MIYITLWLLYCNQSHFTPFCRIILRPNYTIKYIFNRKHIQWIQNLLMFFFFCKCYVLSIQKFIVILIFPIQLRYLGNCDRYCFHFIILPDHNLLYYWSLYLLLWKQCPGLHCTYVFAERSNLMKWIYLMLKLCYNNMAVRFGACHVICQGLRAYYCSDHLTIFVRLKWNCLSGIWILSAKPWVKWSFDGIVLSCVVL